MKLLPRVIVLFIVVSVACTKIVNVSLPGHRPRLVLHGYVATGELFAVSIGKSVAAGTEMDDDATLVENAWALLYEDDVFLDSLKYNAQLKRYATQWVVAAPGKTYKIVAGADGLETVEAAAVASSPVNTVSVIHEKNARNTSYGEMMDDVKFSLRDPGDEKNYYLTALHPSLWRRSGLVCVYSSDPVIERIQSRALPFEEGECIQHDEIFFSDKSFNGSVKQISLSAASRSLATEADTAGNLHRPYLKRYSISEDYYKYLKTALSMHGGSEIPSFAEPVAIKGNVKNGYGLFAVYSVTTDTLR